MSVNKVILVGRLGRAPDKRATKSGSFITNLSIATNHVSSDREGNKRETVEWHIVTFFGRLAEVAERYLKTGDQAYIEGRIKTEKYTDKSGIERYVTKVIGEKLEMLGGRSNAGNEPEIDEPF